MWRRSRGGRIADFRRQPAGTARGIVFAGRVDDSPSSRPSTMEAIKIDEKDLRAYDAILAGASRLTFRLDRDGSSGIAAAGARD